MRGHQSRRQRMELPWYAGFAPDFLWKILIAQKPGRWWYRYEARVYDFEFHCFGRSAWPDSQVIKEFEELQASVPEGYRLPIKVIYALQDRFPQGEYVVSWNRALQDPPFPKEWLGG